MKMQDEIKFEMLIDRSVTLAMHLADSLDNHELITDLQTAQNIFSLLREVQDEIEYIKKENHDGYR